MPLEEAPPAEFQQALGQLTVRSLLQACSAARRQDDGAQWSPSGVRLLKIVLIGILQKTAAGVRAGDRTLRAAPDPLAVMQVDEARHAQQDLACPLGKRQCECRTRSEAGEGREQQVAAIWNAGLPGDVDGCSADRLPHALLYLRGYPGH